MINLNSYKKVNDSFKKNLVFNFGSESGFYSEFNNMVFGILYCLKYGYKFTMISASKSGILWNDFFKPFCDNNNSLLHKKFNTRQFKPKLHLSDYPFFLFHKIFNRNQYFTYELFRKFYNSQFEKERFDIPALNIKGDLRECSAQIVEMIYQFNEITKQEIETIINSIELPDEYAAINIRRGDKASEYKFAETKKYISKLKEVTEIKEVFVFTDDYNEIRYLHEKFSEFNFYTLTDSHENGYSHNAFLTLTRKDRRLKLYKLFASVEIACKASVTIGTYTTNPGLFLGMRMEQNRFYSVQKKSWYQFELDDIENLIVKG